MKDTFAITLERKANRILVNNWVQKTRVALLEMHLRKKMYEKLTTVLLKDDYPVIGDDLHVIGEQHLALQEKVREDEPIYRSILKAFRAVQLSGLSKI